MRYIPFIAATLLLASCGDDAPVPPAPPAPPVLMPPVTNGPPVVIGNPAVTVTENNTAVTTVQASDPGGDPLTFSLSGDDAADFLISPTGVITFRQNPDFELAADADRDNVYQITVSVSDGQSTVTSDIAVTVANDREGIAVRRIATGFNQPVFATPIPGDSRLFVIEKGGSIHLLDPATGQRTLFRTLQNVSAAGEGGLLGIAMASDYQTTDLVYVFVTNANGDIEIRRFTPNDAEGPQGTGQILTIPHPGFTNHYGGWIGFAPDDLFYVATGDGGGSGDPDNNAQDTNSLLGKILRLQINPNPGPAFLIPPGNPFANGGGRGEIYALGLRNPFRASFYNSGLIIGDVGQNQREEVDALPFVTGGGTNFGWPIREGSLPFRGADPGGLTAPLTEYGHGTGPREGRSITGGVVYSGAIADLAAKYVFADFISGNIWSVPLATLEAPGILAASNYERRNDDFAPDVGTIDQMVAFERDSNGNTLIVDFDGDIFIVEPA